MATFKVIVAPHRRVDGTHNIQIRVYHRGGVVRVATPMYATSSQLTRSLKIKDHTIVESCERIIQQWRHTIIEIGSRADALSVKELVALLRLSGEARYSFRLNVVEYLREVAKPKKPNTAHNYYVVASSLNRYTEGHTLDINDISTSFLVSYEAWLRSEGISANTIYLYMATLKAAITLARLTYNDEDSGIVRIYRNPFSRYKLPQLPAPSARGVSLEVMQSIALLDDTQRINAGRDMARDIFLLSFALGGMNYADIYSIPYGALKGSYIEYNRQKTVDARADDALYRVRVEPEVRPLVERYLDPTRQRLFRFHLRYTDKSFAMTISRGMTLVERAVPYERHYTFYAARHTYATLARNAVGLDKGTVHELLNHSDASMKITDRYIERDWQRLFEAHRKIVMLIDWSKICKGE